MLFTSIASAYTVQPDMRTPFTTRPMVTGRAVIVGDFPQSALAAYKILDKGGTAFDAAVGMAATMGVINKTMNDFFGGDAMILIYSAKEKKLITYNGTGWAPKAATMDRYVDEGGIPATGILSAHVPGSVAGWMAMLRDYGTMPLSEILAPAIHIAENGYALDGLTAERAEKNLSKFNQEVLDVFAPNGTPLKANDLVYNKNKAKLYKEISKMSYQEVEDYVYRGPLAKAIVEFSKAEGGLFELEDFAEFKAEKTTPLSTNYKGIDVYACPPNSQGMVLLEALNIVETYDLKALGHNTAEYIDLLSQALNLALADRNRYIGDPRFVEVPYGLITKEYAKERRENGMQLGKAMPDDLPTGIPSEYDQYFREKGGDTTFMAIADEEGNIVACTTSICNIWGAAMMVPGTGVMLNNRMTYYFLEPDVPNSLEPHKRAVQTITPSIALKDGHPYMVFGTPGGDLQEQSKMQGFLNIVEFGMTPQQAVEAARFQSQHPRALLPAFGAPPRTLAIEARVLAEEREKLEKMGYVVISGFDWEYRGTLGMIKIDPTGWKETGADPRGENMAVGW
jgi:gamma-glutamyltranspeptidase/glutathione hydrolase